MLSFINEIDDPIVQRDILDLNRRRELKGDFAQKQATLRALTRHFREQKAI